MCIMKIREKKKCISIKNLLKTKNNFKTKYHIQLPIVWRFAFLIIYQLYILTHFFISSFSDFTI